MAAYLPHTEADIRAMLEKVGLNSLKDLYSDVPQEFLHRGEYDLPEALSEQELREWLQGLDAQNPRLKVFVGQGAYDHYTPAVIPYLTQRSEFITAYTPYQCEISQGTLRYIFEYHTGQLAISAVEDVGHHQQQDADDVQHQTNHSFVIETAVSEEHTAGSTDNHRPDGHGVGMDVETGKESCPVITERTNHMVVQPIFRLCGFQRLVNFLVHTTVCFVK